MEIYTSFDYNFVSLLNFAKWDVNDEITIESTYSTFAKLEFNKLIDSGFLIASKYNHIEIETFPDFENYTYMGVYELLSDNIMLNNMINNEAEMETLHSVIDIWLGTVE